MRNKVLMFTTTVSIIAIGYSLTCPEVLEIPPDKKLTLADMQTMQPKDIVECLAHLGREQLLVDEADYIWKTIIFYYDGIVNIPDSTLMILHWVTAAITPEELQNLTLSNIDVVDNFGLNYNLQPEQLMAIANRVREDFAGKDVEDYTYYDLMALRQILCAFNKSEIERIHPAAYKEAALMIGKLENCGTEQMLAFASLAMNVTAFGSPDGWSDNTIKILGKVAEYLPQDLVARFKIKLEDKA